MASLRPHWPPPERLPKAPEARDLGEPRAKLSATRSPHRAGTCSAQWRWIPRPGLSKAVYTGSIPVVASPLFRQPFKKRARELAHRPKLVLLSSDQSRIPRTP
jgi:hypothetical protein